MTGQVKEDILSRFGELGIVFEEAKLKFKPHLLRKTEFIKNADDVSYVDVNRNNQHLKLEENELFFTICQVPVIYKKSNTNKIEIKMINSDMKTFDSLELSLETSIEVFKRTGQVKFIKVHVDESILK